MVEKIGERGRRWERGEKGVIISEGRKNEGRVEQGGRGSELEIEGE